MAAADVLVFNQHGTKCTEWPAPRRSRGNGLDERSLQVLLQLISRAWIVRREVRIKFLAGKVHSHVGIVVIRFSALTGNIASFVLHLHITAGQTTNRAQPVPAVALSTSCKTCSDLFCLSCHKTSPRRFACSPRCTTRRVSSAVPTPDPIDAAQAISI